MWHVPYASDLKYDLSHDTVPTFMRGSEILAVLEAPQEDPSTPGSWWIKALLTTGAVGYVRTMDVIRL